MKNLIAFSALLILGSAPAFATSLEIVKSCTANLMFPSENGGIDSMETKLQFLRSGDKVTARVTQKGATNDEASSIAEFSVRENVGQADPYDAVPDLNLGERLIAHAMMMTSDELLKETQRTDMDLSQVRAVKVYMVGDATSMGIAAVVEAKDASGKDLGSFLGGFLVAPCK